MKKIYKTITFILLLPALLNAEPLSGIKGLLLSIKGLVKDLIPITFGLAVLAFFYGIARFIYEAGNPESKNKNKAIIYWGVIAIAVMSSVWGIVSLAQNILGIGSGQSQSPSGYDVLGP